MRKKILKHILIGIISLGGAARTFAQEGPQLAKKKVDCGTITFDILEDDYEWAGFGDQAKEAALCELGKAAQEELEDIADEIVKEALAMAFQAASPFLGSLSGPLLSVLGLGGSDEGINQEDLLREIDLLLQKHFDAAEEQEFRELLERYVKAYNAWRLKYKNFPIHGLHRNFQRNGTYDEYPPEFGREFDTAKDTLVRIEETFLDLITREVIFKTEDSYQAAKYLIVIGSQASAIWQLIDSISGGTSSTSGIEAFLIPLMFEVEESFYNHFKSQVVTLEDYRGFGRRIYNGSLVQRPSDRDDREVDSRWNSGSRISSVLSIPIHWDRSRLEFFTKNGIDSDKMAISDKKIYFVNANDAEIARKILSYYIFTATWFGDSFTNNYSFVLQTWYQIAGNPQAYEHHCVRATRNFGFNMCSWPYDGHVEVDDSETLPVQTLPRARNLSPSEIFAAVTSI
ncbi:MAG: hypothetical protein HRU19_29145 [Pseudobacteriovorax sp.]|nr:hypothetical protein [Pseudobacteriovorax sp.]